MSTTAPFIVKRFGNVLKDYVDGSGDCVEIFQLASNVTHSDKTTWIASTFDEAAAWLLCVAHSHATNTKLPQIDQPEISYDFLGFRGQSANYKSLTPSLYRVEKTEHDIWYKANSIFSTIANLWTDTFCQINENGLDFRMDPEACLRMGQHFGIKSPYLDWSYDPISALFFSVDKGVDCLLYTSPSPRDQRGSRMPSSA